METLDPHLMGALTIAGGVSFAMVWLASRMHMLEEREPPRPCPSCGIRVRPGAPCRCTR